jgi:protein-disulfide isomerase
MAPNHNRYVETRARGVTALALASFMIALAAFASRVAGADAAVQDAFDPRLGGPLVRRERAVLGSPEARIVVLELSSFKCTHCRAFHETVFPKLREKYVGPGKVQWVVINASNNPEDQSSQIFLIARYALRQGKYWDIVDGLFQVGLRPPDVLADFVAKSPLIDRGDLETHLRDPSVHAAVAADFAEYVQLHIRGTPTFLVRRLDRNGVWTETRLEDFQPLDFFERVLDELLKTQ